MFISSRVIRALRSGRISSLPAGNVFSHSTLPITTIPAGATGKRDLPSNPSFKDFLSQSSPTSNGFDEVDLSQIVSLAPTGKKFYVETYGCQMNVSDSEIVRSVLERSGYAHCDDIHEADVVLTNTCAVRENAETKVWNRLDFFQSIRKKNRQKGQKVNRPVVGVLGCMAERLRDRLLEQDSVDFVCGPDAYRDVPRLLEEVTNVGQKAANTQLSFEETYADISPVREVGQHSAFVSIMRGCNNMCAFCIVPFTRGRERSRAFSSIHSEIADLVEHKGVKEIVLLGQNVNGYHDTSDDSAALFPHQDQYKAAAGFSNMYRSKKRNNPGARFSDLLVSIAKKYPEVRVRFTSPHPKDFPLDVFEAVAQYPSISPALHLPLQSGSTSMLQRMRRGYSREAFLELVKLARATIPRVKISTDVITGFCGETDEEHADTVSLFKKVRFDQAFMYAYSLREKTHADRSADMTDDVPAAVKQRRLQEVIDTYHTHLREKNVEEEHGRLRLVLVEGPSSRSTDEHPTMTGRTEGNKRVVFPAADIPTIDEALLKRVVALETEKRQREVNISVSQPASLEETVLSLLTDPDGDITSKMSEETVKALMQSGLCASNSNFAINKEFHIVQQEKALSGEVDSNSRAAKLNIGSASYESLSTLAYSATYLDSHSASVRVEKETDVHMDIQTAVGKYVLVRVLEAKTSRLRGVAVGYCSITNYAELMRAAWETRHPRTSIPSAERGAA